MKKFSIMITGIMMMLVLNGCGGNSASYKDGTYSGEGMGNNGKINVDVTVKDGNIDAIAITKFLEDEEYFDVSVDGETMIERVISNKDYYNKAQKANAARDEYASELVMNGSLDGIDAISGATINYNEFAEAVKDALSQAEE